ncbi:capsule biosynthesis protein [Roseibium sp. SCP14]|uniref:capsule biosynthesis protein n=1 Tax=Roseibium sp. SCP14 TaxID=3141375 RepID=UPI0033375D1E
MSGAGDPTLSGENSKLPARRILFLQGPLSPLFKLIGECLKSRGHDVFRINFCAGDWLHWHGENCTSFKGTVGEWPEFLREYIRQNEITDLVLHGDQRLYHRSAIQIALQNDLYVSVTELGALRPGWMTLERNGLSTMSHFPSDPELIKKIAERAEEMDMSPRYPSFFWLQTAPDVAYNLTNVFLKPLFPHYERHTIYPPLVEYARGAVRLLQETKRNAIAERKLAELTSSGARYFVLPLQLEGDFQLRRHSPYNSFAEVLETVFRSLAQDTSPGTHLVLKSHPLDVGFENWPDVSKKLSEKYGVGHQVHFLDGGGLAGPFEAASGVVTLNSTSGLEALQARIPVKTLVPAHYDIAGLTHQGDLSSFWSNPKKPDPELLNSYIVALAATTQVRGSIHNKDGVRVAAKNIADRISARQLNPLGAFVDPPPRLERARELGVPL